MVRGGCDGSKAVVSMSAVMSAGRGFDDLFLLRASFAF